MNAHTRAEALRLVDEMDRAASYIDMPSHCASAVDAYDAATTKLRALLSASDDVPDGYVVVPREPSRAMQDAGMDAARVWFGEEIARRGITRSSA